MQCWYCGKNTMVEHKKLGSGWFKCKECGATWIKPVKLKPLPISGTWRDSSGISHYKAHPVARKKKVKK